MSQWNNTGKLAASHFLGCDVKGRSALMRFLTLDVRAEHKGRSGKRTQKITCCQLSGASKKKGWALRLAGMFLRAITPRWVVSLDNLATDALHPESIPKGEALARQKHAGQPQRQTSSLRSQ